MSNRGLSQRRRRTRAASPRRKQGQVEQPGRDAQRRVTGDDRAGLPQRRQIPHLLRSQGQHDQASQAASRACV